MCFKILFIFLVVFQVHLLLGANVSAVEIECLPLEECAFASRLLTNNQSVLHALRLFNSSKCGVDETTKKVKVWCSKFTNCRTSDNRNGTCIPFKQCNEVFSLLQLADDQKTLELLAQYSCNSSWFQNQINVCCPWTSASMQSRFDAVEGDNSVTTPTTKLAPWNQEGTRQRRRQVAFWFGQPSGNNHNHDHNHDHNGNYNFYDAWQSSIGNNFNNFQTQLQQNQDWFRKVLQENSKSVLGQSTSSPFSNWLAMAGANRWNQKYNLTEESTASTTVLCLTPNEAEGTCKEIHMCKAIVNVLSSPTAKSHEGFLKKFKCPGADEKTIKICCPDNKITVPEPQVEPKLDLDTSSSTFESFNNSKMCGRQIVNDKIIGGTTADLGEFPWAVLFQYSSAKGLVYACGGSIINNRYIVTAAHCVNSNILKQAGYKKLMRVVLGEYDTRNDTDCIYTPYGSTCADPPQYFEVEKIIEHEQFSSTATPFDIALVKVKRNIKFNDYVRPICLPTKSETLKVNQTLTITGWGRTESGETSPVKRKASLPFVSSDNCNQLGPLIEGQMCLGSGKGLDSCKGDSGGPVMLFAPKSNDFVTTLVGIISFGFGRCGTTTSVSTYVPFFVDWISKHII